MSGPQKALRVVVNAKSVALEAGATLLDAVRAAGAYVPTLCFNADFKPRSVCRMCLVDVQGKNKPAAACSTPARDGDVIRTSSKALRAFRVSDVQLLLARHPNDCMKCEVSGSCKLQTLVKVDQVEEKWAKFERGDAARHPEHELHDHSSPSIFRDLDKCIECGLCVDACGPQGQNINAIGFAERGDGMVTTTAFDKPLKDTNCISCGQCTLVCPVGALVEKPAWHDVMHVLEDSERATVVQVAPASRVAIGEEFGLAPGTVSTGKLCNALRALGFDMVADTNFSADVTIVEEANELIARLKGRRGGRLPMLTSCCPGWVNYVEKSRPDLIPHLSTTKSPQQMLGALVKRGPVLPAPEGGGGGGGGGPGQTPYLVSVMPCTAKKDEALRPNGFGDVDAVVTTRELARMLRARRIPFASLPDDGDFDKPFGESTGAAQLFGASGGVMEAALRTAVHALGLPPLPPELEALRGVDATVKEATVEGIGTVAVVNGIANAVELFKSDEWVRRYAMIEVMACRGGCLGGGGEPKYEAPDALRRRAQGVYAIDRSKPKRKSHENEQLQHLYRSFLGEPLGEKSEELLHATYARRGSARDLLGQLLAALDAGHVGKARPLLSPDATWARAEGREAGPGGPPSNSAPPPPLVGADQILASFGCGGGSEAREEAPQAASQRRPHRFLRAGAEDLEVVDPDGRIVRFEVALAPNSAQIQSLASRAVMGGADEA